MTAQFSECLRHQGAEHAMAANPLEDYFVLVGERPAFQATSTALWRGYMGTWEIREGRLYLIGLEGELTDGSPATLATVFPAFPDRVFAHWFNGCLRLPRGKRLKYVHQGYNSIYEEDLLIDVVRGVVQREWGRRNGQAPDPDSPEGYRVSAMTTLPVQKTAEPLHPEETVK